MAWDYTASVVDGGARSASRVQRLLDEGRRALNAVTDGEIDAGGISESGANITMETTRGHTHDGTDAATGSPAIEGGDQGTVRVAIVTKNYEAADTGWSADLNSGTGITKIKYCLFLESGTYWNDVGVPDPDSNSGMFFHDNAQQEPRECHLYVDDTGGTDGLYVYRDAALASEDDFRNFAVLVVGV